MRVRALEERRRRTSCGPQVEAHRAFLDEEGRLEERRRDGLARQLRALAAGPPRPPGRGWRADDAFLRGLIDEVIDRRIDPSSGGQPAAGARPPGLAEQQPHRHAHAQDDHAPAQGGVVAGGGRRGRRSRRRPGWPGPGRRPRASRPAPSRISAGAATRLASRIDRPVEGVEALEAVRDAERPAPPAAARRRPPRSRTRRRPRRTPPGQQDGGDARRDAAPAGHHRQPDAWAQGEQDAGEQDEPGDDGLERALAAQSSRATPRKAPRTVGTASVRRRGPWPTRSGR